MTQASRGLSATAELLSVEIWQFHDFQDRGSPPRVGHGLSPSMGWVGLGWVRVFFKFWWVGLGWVET